MSFHDSSTPHSAKAGVVAAIRELGVNIGANAEVRDLDDLKEALGAAAPEPVEAPKPAIKRAGPPGRGSRRLHK